MIFSSALYSLNILSNIQINKLRFMESWFIPVYIWTKRALITLILIFYLIRVFVPFFLIKWKFMKLLSSIYSHAKRWHLKGVFFLRIFFYFKQKNTFRDTLFRKFCIKTGNIGTKTAIFNLSLIVRITHLILKLLRF